MVCERVVEKQMRKYVESLGGQFKKWTCPGESGVPDRICLLPRRVIIFIEAKRTKGGKISRLQMDSINELRSLGFPAYVVSNLDKFKEIIDRHR
jgi:hypothetical protein